MAEAKKTILIVDDEAVLRKALLARLEEEGFRVLQAADGEEGLKKALKEHPDLILLDVIMPKMTGQEMVKELKKDKWGKEASVIFLTNVSDPIKMAEIGEDSSGVSSVYDYMIKSDFDLDHIVKKINESLQK